MTDAELVHDKHYLGKIEGSDLTITAEAVSAVAATLVISTAAAFAQGAETNALLAESITRLDQALVLLAQIVSNTTKGNPH